jgi:hypothetical protein
MADFYDNATYQVTLRTDASAALAEWPKGATRAPSIWEASTGAAEVNNVRSAAFHLCWPGDLAAATRVDDRCAGGQGFVCCESQRLGFGAGRQRTGP